VRRRPTSTPASQSRRPPLQVRESNIRGDKGACSYPCCSTLRGLRERRLGIEKPISFAGTDSRFKASQVI